MNNRLTTEFLEALNDPNIAVVSFDLFDTLVYRYLFHHSDIFLKLQDIYINEKSWIGGFSDKRQFFESKRRESQQDSEDILIDEIYSCFTKEIDEIACFVNTELEMEDSHIYVNVLLDDWLHMAYKANKRVVIASDFYLSAKQLERIALYKLKNFHLIQHVYVSGEEGVLKSSGNLFKKIAKSENVKESQILHIGDKYKNDYIAPRNLGLKAIYIGLSRNIQKVYEIEREFLSQKPHLLQASRQHVATHSPYLKNSIENTFFEIGSYVFGSVLYAFSYWSLELCLERNLTQVNCLMREGRIFKKTLECVKNSDPRFSHIQINLVYASRASLFLPYLNSDTISDAHMIYGEMTIGEYYKLCRIKPESKEIMKYIDEDFTKSKKHFINEDYSVYDLLLSDLEERKAEISSASKAQAALFIAYLEQLNYRKESMFLDFGGSGSMFSIIDNLLGENSPSVYTLFYEQKKVFENELKIDAFIPYRDEFKKSCDSILMYAPIVEALFNGDEGTTVGFEISDSLVIPICGESYKSFREVFSAFDIGVLEFCRYVINDKKLHQSISERDRLSYAQIINRILVAPTKREAFALGSLPFEKDFSGLSYVTFLNEASLERFKQDGLEKYLFNVVKYNNRSSLKCFWPHGEIARNDEYILPKIHSSKFLVSSNYKDISSILEQLNNRNISSVSIFGAGAFLDDLFLELEELGINIKYIADSNASRNPRKVYGYDVIHPTELIKCGEQTIVIASGTFYEDMKNQLLSLAKNITTNIEIITVSKDA